MNSARDDATPWWRGRRHLGPALVYGTALFIAVVVESLVVVTNSWAPPDQQLPLWRWALDIVTIILSIAALRLRRRQGVAVAVGTTLLSGLVPAVTGPAAVAIASLATRRRWRWLAGLLPVWLATGWLGTTVITNMGGGTANWTDLVSSVLMYVGVVATGAYVGERRRVEDTLRERTETLEREQSLREAQARIGERTRIAREMHDVLAHRISLVAMHSGALAFRTDLPAEKVAETAEVIRSNANLALSELRSVLGVLRGTQDGPASEPDGIEPPQPTLAGLEALVAESGVRVQLSREGSTDLVPDALSRHAFRIVQECLTNARKHAPGQPVRLHVRITPAHGTWWAGAGQGGGTVDIVARNRRGCADGHPGQVVGSGLGLVGLTERAVVAGGELTYGIDRAGEFVVHARLPWS